MWKSRQTTLVTVSSVLLAVAPKCPICFFAYFGIFGVATASASAYRIWLPPLTAIWLAVTVGVLALQRSGQRGYGAVLLASGAGVALYAGKFLLNNQVLVFAGIIGLIAAAVWRSWSRGSSAATSCAPCEQLSVRDEISTTSR